MRTIVFKICMLQIGIRVPPIHHHAQVLIGVNSQYVYTSNEIHVNISDACQHDDAATILLAGRRDQSDSDRTIECAHDRRG